MLGSSIYPEHSDWGITALKKLTVNNLHTFGCYSQLSSSQLCAFMGRLILFHGKAKLPRFLSTVLNLEYSFAATK